MHLIFLTFVLVISFDLNSACKFKNDTKSEEVKYTIQKSINVDDQEGHVIRIFKTETTHKESMKNCEGLKLVKTDFYGISDYIKKNGRVTGYSIGTYDDGSKIFSNVEGIAHSPADLSRNGIVNTTITINGGSGIYKGVTGYGKGTVEFNPETGYSSGSTETYYSIAE